MPNTIPPNSDPSNANQASSSASMNEHSSDIADNDKTLSGQTTAALREAIVKGHIAPGEKLNEPSLAEQFSVSRGPLREAIRRLVAMGLVTHTPHVGATVVTLELSSVVELYEVREVLEGKAAALAAVNMSDEQIAGLRELLNLHHQHFKNNAGEYMQAEGDFDFHYQIINGSGYQTSRFKTRSNKALIEHEQLIYAIEQRDANLAEILMRSHISRAKESIKLYHPSNSKP